VATPRHVPVLLDEALCWLEPGRGGWYVDCTLGLGGHAAALLERFPQARVVGIDRDARALELARPGLAGFGDRVRLAVGRFGELDRHLDGFGVNRVEGVLADLGVSSLQLGVAERGFSFQNDGPLDMRMGTEDEDDMTAQDILQHYSESDLRRVFRELGEERDAARIARAIVERRSQRPFSTTAELSELVERIKAGRLPRSVAGRRRIHPATQVFQALRIEVNRELDQLEELLDQAVNRLTSKGRLVLISYHSLEDRLVKHTLRRLERGEVDPVTGRPRAETQLIEVLTKKPVRPGADEVAANPRSRSARLRAARRI